MHRGGIGGALRLLLLVGLAAAALYAAWVGVRLWLARPRPLTVTAQLLERAEAAVDRLRDRCGTVADPQLRARLAAMEGGAATTLTELRGLAGQLDGIEASLRHHPVDRLRQQYAAHHHAVAGLPAGPVRAAREQGLQSLAEQLASAERLEAARQALLARIETAVLGLDSLDARVAEVCVLSGAPVSAADRVTELSDEVDGMRAGLAEARQVSGAALGIDQDEAAPPAAPAPTVPPAVPAPAVPPFVALAAVKAPTVRPRATPRRTVKDMRLAAGLIALALAAIGADELFGGTAAPAPKTPAQTSPSPGAAGAGGAGCQHKVAFLGDLLGLGATQADAVRLAVKQHNERHPCVSVSTFDTNAAAPAAHSAAIARDPAVLGVVGPVTADEVETALPVLDGAGVPVAVASVSDTGLSGKGWRVFHRTVPTDADQGAAAVRYLDRVLGARRTFLVVESTPFGTGLADVVQPRLGAAFAGKVTVDPRQENYRDAVQRIVDARADAVYFAGWAAGAGRFVNQLRPATAIPLVGTDELVYTSFFKAARDDATVDVVATCACVHPGKSEATFRSRYAAEFGRNPDYNAAEAYDAATVLLAGIAAGRTTRPALIDWMSTYDAAGIARQIRFDAKGDLAGAPRNVWAFTLEGESVHADRIVE
jgi:branched-chain amino acid transport system substrate-binding protein